MDFIVAFLFFTLTLVLFYKVAPNIGSDELDQLNEVQLDSETLTEGLLSEGLPANWTNETVVRIGVARGHVLNISKYKEFCLMVSEDYPHVKGLFSLSSEFVVYLAYLNNSPIKVAGNYYAGHPSVALGTDNLPDLSSIEHKNLATITRLLVYNRTTARMVVYAWA